MFSLATDVTSHLQEKGTLVVPSLQRAHAVKLAFAAATIAQGRRVFTSPDVPTLAVWIRREIESRAERDAAEWPRLLTPAQEWFLWRQSAAEAVRALTLLNESSLSQLLQRSSELAAHYRIKPAAHGADGEGAILCRAQRAFDERCRELQAASASALLERLASAGADRSGADRSRATLWCGFDALPPALQDLAGARFAAPSDAAHLAAVEPTVLRAQDGVEELERIAGWCRERLLEKRHARLLVVLPASPGTRERLAALIRQAIDPASLLGGGGESPVALEGGTSLAQLPMIAHALSTLAWLAGAEADFDSFSRWLRAPYWSRPTAAARAGLDVRLRERPLAGVPLRELLGALRLVPPELHPASRELSGALANAAIALGEGSASPRVWSERFAAALTAAGWPGPLATHGDGQQAQLRWHELLDEFGGLTGSLAPLPCDEALRLVHELADRTPFRPADEDPSVAVSAALVDPIVRYDGIWVAGLHAEAFPLPPEPDPFLPLAAQLAANVPAASGAGRLAQARALLGAWRRSAGELVLSSPAYAEDLELLPSPLVAGLASARASAAAPARAPWLPARLRREGMTESIVDASGRPWAAAQPLPRGTRSLDLQNLCPFRAYAELRLGCTRRERIEPGIAPNRRGELLHAALQRLWERLGDSRSLSALSTEALDALIARSVEEAAHAALSRPSRGRRAAPRLGGLQLDLFTHVPPMLARECRRAERLIRRLCELERARAPFRVEAIESDMRLSLAGATLHMRVDRVDALEGGGRTVLDYKSGRPIRSDWLGERPTHPQLLAYAQALGDDVAAIATVVVSAREVRFDGVARAANLLPAIKPVSPGGDADGWLERQIAWRAIVVRLIRGFLAGDAAVDPRPGACEYCHVRDACRIAEAQDA